MSKRMNHNNKSASHRRAYNSWKCMMSRCYNKKNASHKWYKEKKIKVCEKWKESFLEFLKDMGDPPTKKHTLDRINGDRSYYPENCRWATPQEQAINKKAQKEKRYIGVHKRQNGTYRAICGGRNNKLQKSGFETKEEAALQYNIFSKMLYGEDAFQNEI